MFLSGAGAYTLHNICCTLASLLAVNVAPIGKMQGLITLGFDAVASSRLHGEVHAGGKSDRQATIAALEMSPQQLRIADVAAYGSRQMTSAGHPEIAVVNNNGLQIELLPFEGLKPGAAPHLLSSTQSQQNEPASAAMFTGAYILVAGLALLLFPLLTFGLLFDPR